MLIIYKGNGSWESVGAGAERLGVILFVAVGACTFSILVLQRTRLPDLHYVFAVATASS